MGLVTRLMATKVASHQDLVKVQPVVGQRVDSTVAMTFTTNQEIVVGIRFQLVLFHLVIIKPMFLHKCVEISITLYNNSERVLYLLLQNKYYINIFRHTKWFGTRNDSRIRYHIATRKLSSWRK